MTKEVVLDKVHPTLTLKEGKEVKEAKEPKESAKKKEESAYPIATKTATDRAMGPCSHGPPKTSLNQAPKFSKMRKLHVAAGFAHTRREHDLPLQVVAHDPVLPELIHSIHQKSDASGESAEAGERSGIKERQPALARNPRFHPAMRIRGAHHLPSGHRIVNASQEADRYARGNAQRAQHDCHR